MGKHTIPAKSSRMGTNPVKKVVVRKDLAKPNAMAQRPTKRNTLPVKPSTITTKGKSQVKKPVEKKPVSKDEGHYELSPLMSKALEAELNVLMPKLKVELPESGASPAKKVVYEKFKTKVLDTLRNTLGLTVTKRLLPVNTSLYIKMVFCGKPFREDLAVFLKKYDITQFKRVSGQGGRFIATVKNFQSFDAVCTANPLHCGNVKVKATPCYKFTHCPANLRTIYDGTNKPRKENEAEKKSNEQEKKQEKPAEENKTPSATSTDNKVDGKESKTSENKTEENKTTAQATVQTAKKTNDTVAPKVNTAPAKTVTAKANIQTDAKNQVQTPKKTNDTAAPKVTAPAKTVGTAKSTVQTVAKTNQAEKATNQTALAKATPSKPKEKVENTETPKATPTNTKPASKPEVKAKQDEKPKVTVKTDAEKAKVGSTKPNPAKTPSKPKVTVKTDTEKAKVATTKLTQAKAAKKSTSDFDELDDRDILALLSEGIVLDECSGSDDEAY